MSAAAAVVFALNLRPPACVSAVADEVQVCGHGEELDPVVAFTVNGAAGRMLVDPGGPNVPVCNADFAARAGFPEAEAARVARIGPVEIEGRRGRVAFAGLRWRLSGRVQWTQRPAVTGADCWMGPAALREKRVTFRLGPPLPGARTVALPIYDRAGGDSDSSTDARIGSKDAPVMVRFDALRDPTALSASAVLALAGRLGATVEGEVVQGEILFGVSRPLRRLRVRTPLAIGPLVPGQLWARVDDYGDANGVRSVDPAEAEAGDVEVTGPKRAPERSRIVRVGRSDLARCAAITFDFGAKRILLTC